MGYDARWRKTRAAFLDANPTCIDCGHPATVADHAPRTRRQLLADGVANPDAWDHLQPRCATCHGRKTVLHDGGFGRPARKSSGSKGVEQAHGPSAVRTGSGTAG